MADLFNQQISATYSGLLKTTSSGVLTSSLTQITDGRGNGSPLYISTVAINFYNAYTFPSTDGTADQILSTDGAGAITWVDVSGGDVLKTGTIVANEIAIWNDNDSTLRSDPTLTIDADHKITLYQPNSVPTDLESYNIGGGNIANTTGIENVGFGKDNLLSNTTGSYNLAIGKDALFSNTTGSTNVAIGRQSMYNNLGGGYNMALGSNALLSNTTGLRNVAIGSQAVEGNTSGNFNIGIGETALKQNTTASYQIAIGADSLYLNNGGYNTAIGYEALRFNTSGVQNTSIGYQSMRLSTTGDVNTAIGYGSGGSLTTGSYNVLIGGGNAITTGSSNVVIGRDGGSSIYNLSNRIIISDGDGNIRQTFDNSGAATFNGSVTADNSTFATAGGGLSQTTIGKTSGGYAGLRLAVDATYYSWIIGAQYNVGNAFEITPSTAVGGSTFTTPVFKILNTGAATFNATDSTGNRTNPFNTLTITTDNPNAPYDKFGGSILFNNRSYTHGIVSSARIRSYISDGGGSEGGGFIFETTPTAGGALTPTLTLSYTGAATFSNQILCDTNTTSPTSGSAAFYKSSAGAVLSGYQVILETGSSGARATALTISNTGAATFSGQINANNGISFPNGSPTYPANAETLDAYEEGTWTPNLLFGGANVGMTYFDNNAKYTKIGRQVSITIYLALTGVGSSTGDATISGLPYTSGSSGRGYASAGAIFFDNISYTGQLQVSIGGGGITILFQKVTESGVDSNLTNSNFSALTEMSISFTYFV